MMESRLITDDVRSQRPVRERRLCGAWLARKTGHRAWGMPTAFDTAVIDGTWDLMTISRDLQSLQAERMLETEYKV